MEEQAPYGQNSKQRKLATLQDSKRQLLKFLASEMNALKIMKSIQQESENNKDEFLTQAIRDRENFLFQLLKNQQELYRKI